MCCLFMLKRAPKLSPSSPSVEAFPIGGNRCFLLLHIQAKFPSLLMARLPPVAACIPPVMTNTRGFTSHFVPQRQRMPLPTSVLGFTHILTEVLPPTRRLQHLILWQQHHRQNSSHLPHFMRLSTENLLKPLMSHRLFYMQIHLTKAHTLRPASACLCVLFDALEQPQNARFMSVRVKFHLHPSAPLRPPREDMQNIIYRANTFTVHHCCLPDLCNSGQDPPPAALRVHLKPERCPERQITLQILIITTYQTLFKAPILYQFPFTNVY